MILFISQQILNLFSRVFALLFRLLNIIQIIVPVPPVVQETRKHQIPAEIVLSPVLTTKPVIQSRSIPSLKLYSEDSYSTMRHQKSTLVYSQLYESLPDLNFGNSKKFLTMRLEFDSRPRSTSLLIGRNINQEISSRIRNISVK